MDQNYGGFSLRTVCFFIIIISLIIFGVMFYDTQGLTSTLNRLTDANRNHITLNKVTHELMDASDYLTERAQRFTVKGDMRYLNEYFTEAFETKRREKSVEAMSTIPGASVALIQLQRALDGSFELMNREYYAMRLVCEAKGYSNYPNELNSVEISKDDEMLSAEDKMRRANEMVLDEEYYAQKDRIRSDVKGSLDALKELTFSNEADSLNDFKNILNYEHVFHSCIFFGTVLFVCLLIFLFINPIIKAVELIKSNSPLQEQGFTEFRYIARAYNIMVAQLKSENEKKDASQSDL